MAVARVRGRFDSFNRCLAVDFRPDINAIKGISSNTSALQLAPVQFAPPALEDLEAPRRQTSMDGEAIKIVIHDVDSGPICASKRHVVLRRDPMDKAHRSEWGRWLLAG